MSDYRIPDWEPGRLVRVRFPAALLRQIEELLEAGVGGYTDRSELVVDAVRERLLELGDTHVPTGVTATNEILKSRADSTFLSEERSSEMAELVEVVLRDSVWRQGQEEEGDVSAPVVSPPSRDPAEAAREVVVSMPEEAAIVIDGVLSPIESREDTPQKGPLFGLHNRDFPSLWALTELGRYTAEGPIAYSEFMIEVAASAWKYGEMLVGLERQGIKGLTSLFPTNPDKREASEGRFLNFGVGEAKSTKDGWATRGPLFQWGVAGIVVSEGVGSIGVTPLGVRVIGQVVGLTPDIPHPQEIAVGFAEFLQASAPDDWWGFQRLLTAVGAGASTRNEVAIHFHGSRFGDDWTKNEVSTNAAGYVARAREWGFLEQKQQAGRYVLTDLGREILAQGEAPESATPPNDISTTGEKSQ